MRKNLLRISTALVTLALVLSVAWGLTLADEPQGAAPMYMLPSTDGPAQAAAPEVNRFIIQLEDAPLATYMGGVKGYAPTAIQATGANRLDVNASASRAYIGYLQGKQEAFKAELAKALSSASVSTYVDESGMAHDLAYQVTFNGVVVTLPKASPQALRTLAKMDGVKQVFRDYEHQPDMYASLTLIDAPTMWSQLGGQDVSGEGMIVASIDTGVYAPNPFFDPTGYQYPPGYPVGDRRYTTKKVIGARAYFRPWDPPTAGDEGAWPGPNGSSHGTHTIGTTAGNADTVADVAGLEKTISGVAPKAQILSYRIGYPTASEFSGSAFSAEIVMAFEDAVVDGADSINYSFGGYSGVMPWADAVAVARDATWDAGVFVSHSAGNSGPGSSTTWDSSPKVMEVAASSTTGTIATGRLSITAPEPVPPEVQEMALATASFGGVLEPGNVYSWSLVTAAAVDPANFEGCNAWPADTFTGKAAIISRGVCEFGVKVLNAEQAGAEFVVIYNHESGGDSLVNMAGGEVGGQVTIPSVFIYHSSGLAIVDWYDTHGEASALELDLVAFQAGNVPDVIAGFSSRGPAFARFLEPDVTAPGVNILSGGYATGATGVDQHAGFGQASGTSMAAPHVAGAAALVKQMHPDWTPTQIRSALMTTSVIEVWLDADQTVPASVLDMGAGRIDLGKAGDPGLTFDYPSVSFGGVTAPATATAIVQATEVCGESATYDLSTTADEGITASTDLRGITVEPGSTASFELTVEAPEGTEPGDYGGFVWLDDGVHLNHIPFWVRVEAPPTAASVLLIDNDMSDLLGFPDYADFYADTLDNLGVAYDYYNADLHYANPQTLLSAAKLAAYDVIIYWSGDNYYPDGSFTVATPLTEFDMQILTDWQSNGGRLLATGQDLASAWDWSDVGGFLYAGNLGAGYLQDSIFDPFYAGMLPPVPAVVGQPGSPLSGMALDISGSAPIFDEEENLIGWEDGAGNQYYVDEVELAPFGDTEAPDSVFPILAAIGGYPIQEGYVASARADSPTLERPQARYDYRSLYLSFGFEGINNDTGYTTREELMGELLNWLNDEVTVTLGSAGGMVNDLITLSADAASSVGAAAVEYRWDFGDSSDVAVSTTPSVVHVYASGGTYTVRVEVTDEYGHKAVDEATVTIIGSRIYLPLVFKSYTYVAPASFTILHTNDFHGRLETDSSGRGGSAYMASMLGDIREEVGEANVFLMDAGDVFFGAPPISQLMMGESTIEVYNMLGYDVAAFGNHEFDKGQEVLIERVEQSDFPWIGANIVLEGTEWEHPTWIKPYVILSNGEVDLGVIGLDTDETPLVTLKGTTDGLEFTHLTDAVLHYYDEVMAKADALIVLAHMGTEDSGEFEGLQTVAQELIDAGKPVGLIIAGHQHQALSAPVMVGDTAIVGAGYYGRYLGRVDLSFDYDTQSVTLEDYELITINNELEADPEVEAEVAYWAEQVAPLVEQVVGYTNVDLVRDYNAESNMGNLVTDGMLWKADEYDDGEVNGSVDIAFTNPGGLRAEIEIPEGTELPYEVTWGDTFNVLPFGNTLFLMDLTGAEVQELLDQAAKLYKGILQTSGAQWYWYNDCDCDAPTNWGAYGATVDGEPLDPEATYRVVTNNFLAGGQDGWVTFADGTNRWDTYYDMQWGVNEYIEWYNTNVGPIDHQVEGRIVKMDKLISILHTNDTHGTWPATSYYSTLEGMAYLATSIAAERAKNPNTLLIDAGDTFQGNAFAQYFRNATPNPIAGGMNMLEYDAMVLGNHEFNFGPTTFATMLGQLDIPILGSANLDDDGAYGFINDNVEDYITLNVDGVDVAIFGLTNPEVPIYELPSNIAGLTFYPAITTAQALVPQIRADEDPDLLIALTHIGYDVYKGSYDKDKAIAEQVPGIDVIVGGHSHTKIDPAVMITSDVNPNGTLVAQTKAYAEYLGKINIGFVSDGNGGYDVVLREGYLLPANDMSTDADMVAYLAPFEAELEAYTSTEIGQTTAPLDALNAYTEETTGANVQADAAVWMLTDNGIAVDFHLSGAMSNRKVADDATAENPVTLTIDDMYTLMPYENSLVAMQMNGPQLKAVLERAYRNYYYYKYVDGYGGYSHYTTCMLDINAGGVITYTDTYPAEPDGNNVVGLAFNGTVVDFADADTYYNVSTVNYLAAGSCNFNNDGVTLWPLDQMTADTQYYVRDSVIDYIEHEGTISPAVEGRLQFIPVPRVTILHTNDTHAHLESFLVGNVLQGGVARRYTAIQQVKAETDNVILVDAGDAFQGTLYFNVWQGEEEAYFMNALGYQAMAVGNHEFDSGPATLADFIGLADFPVLSANIDASAEPTLAGLIPAYTILDVADGQIGVFGLTTEETSFISSPGPNVVFNDVVVSAQATVTELEGLGINRIVALSHNGYSADQSLAAAVDGIDVIVCGHSHTLLGSMDGAAGPYPTEVTSPAGDTVLIVSAQEWGKYLGRLDVAFTADGKVQSYIGGPIFIDESFAEDTTIAADVATFAEPIEDLKNTVIGQAAVNLEGTRALVRSQETNLSNLICNAMLWETAVEGTQICVQNGGGIRASIPAGDVTMGQVLEVQPFGNQIATFGLTGADVWAALENGVSCYETQCGRFPQVGGLRYFFDPSLGVGSRIVSVEVKNAEGGYDPINLDTVYKLTSNDFMRRGGDGYDMFANNAIDPYDFGAVQADALAEYIGVHSPVSPAVEGRIVKLDKLVTILHTNDTHGWWSAGTSYGDPAGFVYLASQIAAERAKNPNTLLIDAGDTFQGNAFAQYFRNATPNPIAGGMNLLGYDAMTLGNHEFNFGPTTFATMLGQLDCQILGSANLDDDGSYGFINDNVEDYINLDVDGVKVSIFGLTNPRVYRYELPTNIPGLTFHPATETAASLVPTILATEDPDLLIGLTHIGYQPYGDELDSDELVAQEVAGIDVIVGGHSHTRLDPAVMVTSDVNPNGTLIAHARRYALYLGKVNVGLVSDGNGGYDVVFREGYLLPAGDAALDAEMVTYLEPFEDELEAYTSTEIGQTTAPIDALEAYTEETTGANVQTDAAVWELTNNGIDVDFHLSGAMSNRKVADDATPENPVTLTIDDMYTLMPYENSLVVMEMNGPQLKAVLERAYRNWWYYNYTEDHGGYSYYTTCMLDINAGGVITYTDTYPAEPDGNNVVGLSFNSTVVDFTDADTFYNVSSVNYLAAGSCNFNDDGVTLWPLDQMVADTQFYVRDSVIDYVTAVGTISPAVEGRLVFLTD